MNVNASTKPLKMLKPINPLNQQRGLGLLSLLFWVALLGSLLLLGMRVVPAVTEYIEIKKAVSLAKTAGDANAIRSSFDQQSKANYVDKFSGQDLRIESTNGLTTVAFAYQRVIPLAGPASLLLDFSGKELVR
jgi:hypothetical protein